VKIPDITIREATISDLPSLMNVIDASLLYVDIESVKSSISSNDVLVATSPTTILGVLISKQNNIEAIAVRSRRRHQGIGSALVRSLAKKLDGPLIAEFDGPSLQFYQKLGFSLLSEHQGRFTASYQIID